MTLGGAAQVAAAHCPNERTLDPAVCSYNRPTNASPSRTMAFTRNVLRQLTHSLTATRNRLWVVAPSMLTGRQ